MDLRTARDRQPVCYVCNNLDWQKFNHTSGSTCSSTQELNDAVQRGCPSCFLISKGISEFCSSLATEYRDIYNILTIQRIDMILLQDADLHFRLHFHLPDGGSASVLLELFSPSSKLIIPH
jgi:hypothetical protein